MLRRIKEKILINSVATAPTGTNGTTARVISHPYGVITIPKEAVVKSSIKMCGTACTAQVATLTLQSTLPDTCECPYEFGVWIETIPHNSYKVLETFKTKQYYAIQISEANQAVATYGAAMTAAINADPFATVTAAYSGGVITLTEKSCATTNGFTAYTDPAVGAYAVTTPHVEERLQNTQMRMLFPLKQGDFGGNPYLPLADTLYCRFDLVVSQPIQDVDGPSHYNSLYAEYELYVNATAGAAYTAWLAAYDTAFGSTAGVLAP